MTFFPRRFVAVLASAGVMTLLATGGYPLGAQEGSSAKAQTSRSKQTPKTDAAGTSQSAGKSKAAGRVAPPDAAHRLPPGYSKLGLSDAQKAAILKIQGTYYPQIQSLEKQVDALQAKRKAECEAVLKPAQKRLLDEQEQQRKAAAAKKAAARKAARAAAKEKS
ncbi:MAG: hypothetical protein ACP5XB_12635 [Isosphaeraceae bacterium]